MVRLNNSGNDIFISDLTTFEVVDSINNAINNDIQIMDNIKQLDLSTFTDELLLIVTQLLDNIQKNIDNNKNTVLGINEIQTPFIVNRLFKSKLRNSTSFVKILNEQL